MTNRTAFVTSFHSWHRTQFALPANCGANLSPARTSRTGTNPPHLLQVIAQDLCVSFTKAPRREAAREVAVVHAIELRGLQRVALRLHPTTRGATSAHSAQALRSSPDGRVNSHRDSAGGCSLECAGQGGERGAARCCQ